MKDPALRGYSEAVSAWRPTRDRRMAPNISSRRLRQKNTAKAMATTTAPRTGKVSAKKVMRHSSTAEGGVAWGSTPHGAILAINPAFARA